MNTYPNNNYQIAKLGLADRAYEARADATRAAQEARKCLAIAQVFENLAKLERIDEQTGSSSLKDLLADLS